MTWNTLSGSQAGPPTTLTHPWLDVVPATGTSVCWTASVGNNPLWGTVELPGNTATYGGGLSVESATLAMHGDSRVSGNTSSNVGGGIYSIRGVIDLYDGSAVVDNTSSDNGGGIDASGGMVKMSQSSSISNNTAAGSGGAIAINHGTHVTLYDDSTLAANQAVEYFGGAIYMGPGAPDWPTNVVTLNDQSLSARTRPASTGEQYRSTVRSR